MRDLTSGYLALDRRVVERVSLMQDGYGQYFMKLIYDAERAGFQTGEVGYVFNDRTRGSSKTDGSLLEFARLGVGYWRDLVRIRLGRA